MAAQTAMAMPRNLGGEGNVIKTTQVETETRVPLVGHIITDEDIGSLQVNCFNSTNPNYLL